MSSHPGLFDDPKKRRSKDARQDELSNQYRETSVQLNSQRDRLRSMSKAFIRSDVTFRPASSLLSSSSDRIAGPHSPSDSSPVRDRPAKLPVGDIRHSCYC